MNKIFKKIKCYSKIKDKVGPQKQKFSVLILFNIISCNLVMDILIVQLNPFKNQWSEIELLV